MSKRRRILTVCLVMSVIALVIQVVIAVIGHEPINTTLLVSTGIVPVVLLSSLLSTIILNEKHDDNKK